MIYMCGIFGVVLGQNSAVKPEAASYFINCLARLSEARGKEAAGLAMLTCGYIQVYKRPMRARKMLHSKDYKTFLSQCLKDVSPGASIAAIGHARLVTNGSQASPWNNQPVVVDHSVGVHNGIIVNVDSLWLQHPDIHRRYEVDTEVLFRLIDKYHILHGSLSAAIAASFKEIKGSASIAFFSDEGSRLGLATNTGSLYTAYNQEAKVFLFASEKYFIRQILRQRYIRRLPGNFKTLHLSPGSGLSVNTSSLEIEEINLLSESASAYSCKAGLTIPIVDHSMPAKELRRCTRCVLPETFPLINFDEAGVCNQCRNYQHVEEYGHKTLETLVERYRSKDGSPDCIIALSGGRDSCYGLHYLKAELGMNPITFTYDWGMVTDLARRNIASVCGKLGVENIIRSPNIATKRKNIRRNIEAWLCRPELGLIPLFMAGDKQFFHIARQLRRETETPLVFFCAGTRLERTEFKTAFCGIRESDHCNRLWDYSIRNKLDLLWYYGKNFLINPRYLNKSIFDTMFSYYSSYIARDDFVYFYQYIPWDEKVIMETLVKNYDWEVADDTLTTWRIGDGTAAFYNYIYYTVAGFSEHDTFRSNQIRAGLITREEGLRLIEQDNQPRYESMREYALLVGFNLEEALTVINSIPKLYGRRS